ncbi:hypothetical protein AX15_006220, partial [Amanita polypyramis BW_CC]
MEIKMPTPQRIQERLQLMASDITSLEYIDKTLVKIELLSPKDIVMEQSQEDMVIVNPAPITKGKGKEKVYMDLVAEGTSRKMDTSEDFTNKSSSTMQTALLTSSLKSKDLGEKVNKPFSEWKGYNRGQSTPMHTLLDPKSLAYLMTLIDETLPCKDQIKFREELQAKNYSVRSTYLEVMLDGLLGDVLNNNLHQGHYEYIGKVYDNFNDPIVKFEDQIESVEKNGSLFAILPYELYGDFLVHWLTMRKYIQQAINIPSDGSMEKI